MASGGRAGGRESGRCTGCAAERAGSPKGGKLLRCPFPVFHLTARFPAQRHTPELHLPPSSGLARLQKAHNLRVVLHQAAFEINHEGFSIHPPTEINAEEPIW